jgi:hypothetical protein
MTTESSSESGRLEQILRGVDYFKPVATRRRFMQKLVLAGSAAAVGAASLGKVATVFADAGSVATGFVVDAIGAERIGIAFYGNALGEGSDFSVGADVATKTLLNESHRGYFRAAKAQETSHLDFLEGVRKDLQLDDFPFSTFGFLPGSFDSAGAMLALGAKLEAIFIGAYLGAVAAGATLGGSLGTTVAEAAAQICGIECEHRVLINDIAGMSPPNDRFYEGNTITPVRTGVLGDTGVRSTVYATGDLAVADLTALLASAT